MNESKQVGIIYHFTDPLNALKILQSNKLLAGNSSGDSYTNGISFTRNKNLNRGGCTAVHIVINGDKLSNRYHIEPLNVWSHMEPLDGHGPYDREDEERVTKLEIKDILKYIIRIDIHTKVYNNPRTEERFKKRAKVSSINEYVNKIQKYGVSIGTYGKMSDKG